jgi:hypothetical protein
VLNKSIRNVLNRTFTINQNVLEVNLEALKSN